MQNNNSVYNWKYTPLKKKEDPYENIISDIQNLALVYNDKNEQEQENIVEEIFSKIRKINVFPIIYFNEEGIEEEILSVYNKNDVSFVEGGVYTQLRNGLLLLDYLFPNLHLATTCNEKKNMYERFYDDDILKKSIRSFLKQDKNILNLRTMFFKYARLYYDTPINFSPMRAKLIFEHFCPKNGVIYDYSAGYGGRMLGALSSQQDFTYVAVEPNTETFYNLNKLGKYIDNTIGKRDYHIFNICSERFVLEKESVDFAFSCPPFFKKEVYSNEITQSINNYPIYKDWLDYYVKPTIQNCYNGLKENGVYGVDILNYTYGGKTYTLIEDWIKVAEEVGFIYKGKIPVASRFRKKEGQGEFVYLFMKKEEYELPDYTPNKVQEDAKEAERRKERAKYRRANRTVGEYDIFGKLIQLYDYYNCPIDEEFVKSKKLCNNKYYRIYYGEDVIQQKIEVKNPVCQIEDIYFFSYSEAGRYLGTSRQAVAQAKSRKSKQVNDKEIIWFEEV